MLHNRFWQAFFALAPIIGLIVGLIGYVGFMYSMVQDIPHMREDQLPASFFEGMGFFMLMILLTLILALGSLVFYIAHAAQNPNLQQGNMLLVWILLFVFVGGIGQIVYWIVEILGKNQDRHSERNQ